MKNKFLTILCVLILISLIFINICFAYSPDEPITLPDEGTINIIKNREEYLSGNYNVVFAYSYSDPSKNFMFFYPKNSSVSPLVTYNNNNSCYQLYLGNEDEHLSIIVVENNYKVTIRTDSIWFDSTTIFWADTNIYMEDGTLFFQHPPVILGIIAPKLEAVKMNPLKEILILVPIMIILIASYLGLRKGLTFIKTLRKI